MTARTEFRTPRSASADLLLVAVPGRALDVAARLLPHVPNFSPVAAAALFAGMMLGRRSLALAGAARRDADRRSVHSASTTGG